jgi:hypothetical protein
MGGLGSGSGVRLATVFPYFTDGFLIDVVCGNVVRCTASCCLEHRRLVSGKYLGMVDGIRTRSVRLLPGGTGLIHAACAESGWTGRTPCRARNSSAIVALADRWPMSIPLVGCFYLGLVIARQENENRARQNPLRLYRAPILVPHA